jgi:hypothetical protein
MYSIRGNGDNIAQEFFNILGNSQSLKKVAEVQEDHVDDSVNYVEDPATGSELTDDQLRDLLVDDSGVEGGEVDYNIDLEDQIEDMVDYAEDGDQVKAASTDLVKEPSGEYIMNGLGKISASLRNKGEGFAADVVEATAFSIRGDLAKEDQRKSGIISSLNKLASDFINSGDSFAADMVQATIVNIQ